MLCDNCRTTEYYKVSDPPSHADYRDFYSNLFFIDIISDSSPSDKNILCFVSEAVFGLWRISESDDFRWMAGPQHDVNGAPLPCALSIWMFCILGSLMF